MKRLTRKSSSTNMVWFVDHDNNNMDLEPCEMSYTHNKLAIQKLAYYEDLEEQGLFLRLPCKIGDIVWKTQYYPYTRIVEEKFSLEMIDEFGKRIFLRKDEAEKEQKRVLSNRTPSCWC